MVINNRNLFLTVLGGGKSKIKGLAESVSDEIPLPGSETADFSLCPHVIEGTRELSGVPFIRALIPFVRVLPKAFL